MGEQLKDAAEGKLSNNSNNSNSNKGVTEK